MELDKNLFSKIAGSDGCCVIDGKGFEGQVIRIRTKDGQCELQGSRVECLVLSVFPRRLEFVCSNPPESYPFICSEVTCVTTYSNHDCLVPPKAPTIEKYHSQN